MHEASQKVLSYSLTSLTYCSFAGRHAFEDFRLIIFDWILEWWCDTWCVASDILKNENLTILYPCGAHAGYAGWMYKKVAIKIKISVCTSKNDNCLFSLCWGHSHGEGVGAELKIGNCSPEQLLCQKMNLRRRIFYIEKFFNVDLNQKFERKIPLC